MELELHTCWLVVLVVFCVVVRLKFLVSLQMSLSFQHPFLPVIFEPFLPVIFVKLISYMYFDSKFGEDLHTREAKDLKN